MHMLDQPMSEALSDISLPNSIKETLIEHEGTLMPIFKLVNTYERGDWDEAYALAKKMKWMKIAYLMPTWIR